MVSSVYCFVTCVRVVCAAGQEIVATVFGVTRYPLTLNYFGKTPK